VHAEALVGHRVEIFDPLHRYFGHPLSSLSLSSIDTIGTLLTRTDVRVAQGTRLY
jgi:hypothetical protein